MKQEYASRNGDASISHPSNMRGEASLDVANGPLDNNEVSTRNEPNIAFGERTNMTQDCDKARASSAAQ
jgi:hypothetical protein